MNGAGKQSGWRVWAQQGGWLGVVLLLHLLVLLAIPGPFRETVGRQIRLLLLTPPPSLTETNPPALPLSEPPAAQTENVAESRPTAAEPPRPPKPEQLPAEQPPAQKPRPQDSQSEPAAKPETDPRPAADEPGGKPGGTPIEGAGSDGNAAPASGSGGGGGNGSDAGGGGKAGDPGGSGDKDGGGSGTVPPKTEPKPQPPKAEPPKPTVDVKALLKQYGAGVKSSILSRKHYPEAARRLGHSGSVKVRLVVSSSGGLDSVEVASSSGHDELDGAAIDAVRSAAPFGAFPAGVEKATVTFTFTLNFGLS